MTILIQNGTIQSDKTKFSRDEIEKWHAGFMRDCPTGKEHGFEIYTRRIPNGPFGLQSVENMTSITYFTFIEKKNNNS